MNNILSTLKHCLIAMWMAVSATAVAAPDGMRLPFSEGETWVVPRGYGGTPTHVGGDYFALDLATDGGCMVTHGKPVLAVLPGRVERMVVWNGDTERSYGNNITLSHAGKYSTRYAHLSAFASYEYQNQSRMLKVGDYVSQGQVIGYVGATGSVVGARCDDPSKEGAHLHFVLYDKTGKSIKPEPLSGATNIAVNTRITSTNQARSNGVIPNDDQYCSPVSSGEDLCWRGETQCVDGSSVSLYDYRNFRKREVTQAACGLTANCSGSSECFAVGGYGTTLAPTDAVAVSKPDFLVKKLSLHTPWGPESYKYGLMESFNTKAQSGNTGEGSCLPGEKDTIIGHFYLSKGYKEDAHGDWRKVDSTETRCDNLKPGDTNTETKNTVISDWIQVPGIYNIVYCIDHPKTEQNNGGDHAEKHESNNCSTEAVFEVTRSAYENTTSIDLKASQLQFRGTPPVYAADSVRLGAWITNAGTQGLYTDIRSSYGVSCNGSPPVQLADDGTEAKLLGPGMNAWEEILSPVTLPNVSGSCIATFCADHAYMVNEVNKANNCTSLGFNLLPRTNLPDLITHSAGIAGGKTRVKAGDKIVPAFYTQNIGNTRPSVTTQALFQY